MKSLIWNLDAFNMLLTKARVKPYNKQNIKCNFACVPQDNKWKFILIDIIVHHFKLWTLWLLMKQFCHISQLNHQRCAIFRGFLQPLIPTKRTRSPNFKWLIHLVWFSKRNGISEINYVPRPTHIVNFTYNDSPTMTHNLTINSPQSVDAHMFLKNYFMRTWIQLSIFLIASPSFCFNCMEHTQVWQWLVLPTLGPTNIFYEFSIIHELHNNC